jgi:nucleoside phosphorylase|tara:strand:+ start:1015 stop:1200 length:186 start_codon:yes stop_codon:yes gene_type:complete
MEMLIGFIDKIMPGRKTYLLMVVGMGMVACQMLGYHQFSPEAWGMMGIGGAATWKMGMDRK